MARSIVVVCVGNICRSPMAEVMLAAALPSCEVSSAGLGALVGDPAHPTSIELMSKRGLDLRGHIARQLDESIVNGSDMVLTMEKAHTDYITSQWPQARGRVFRWGHWEAFDIPDPYRRGEQAFEDALALIDTGLKQWADKLRQLG